MDSSSGYVELNYTRPSKNRESYFDKLEDPIRTAMKKELQEFIEKKKINKENNFFRIKNFSSIISSLKELGEILKIKRHNSKYNVVQKLETHFKAIGLDKLVIDELIKNSDETKWPMPLRTSYLRDQNKHIIEKYSNFYSTKTRSCFKKRFVWTK